MQDKAAKADVIPVRQRTQYSWESLPLGKVPDYILAQQVGCRRLTVLAARRARGIPAFDKSRSNKGIDWDAAPLGQMPDVEIARLYGVAPPVVAGARDRRGISPYTPREVDVDWGSAPLGNLPDAAVARELGVSEPTVSRHRNQRGISPFRALFLTTEGEVAASHAEALIDLYWHEQGVPHKFQVTVDPYVADWVINEDTLVEYAGFIESRAFGQAYRARLATKVALYKNLGWSVLIIYPKDLDAYRPRGVPTTTRDLISGGINWSRQPLGQMTDTELAARLGITQPIVTHWRNTLGIGPYNPPSRDWTAIPLGAEPDHAIASRLGVSKETVRRARVERGILAYGRHHAA